MLKTNHLEAYKLKDLAQMAKQRGITGWHSMRKAQLVNALAKAKASAVAPSKSSKKKANGSKVSVEQKSDASKRIRAEQQRKEQLQDLATKLAKGKSPTKDRLVLMVRDSYWLHAYWELTEKSVQRAKAALSERWHGAKPVLRVYQATRGRMASSADQVFRTIEIHGGANHWYIDVKDPPMSFRVEIGYLSGDHFHCLARSNVVTTPRPGGRELLDGHWADVLDDADRVYALSGGFEGGVENAELQQLFEERLRRPMGSPMVTRFGSGAENALNQQRQMRLDIEAEMIVYGVTDSDAYVTMGGEPVRLSADGSFSVRMAMPDKRQVIPVVAGRSDGVEEQTVVLAVERNTKVLEPRRREING